MQSTLFEYSIYTIAHPDKLANAASAVRPTRFSEARIWRTGCDLWREATAAGTIMPVLLADATDCSSLLYWGKLTNVVVDDNGTQYWVKEVRKIKGRRTPQELLLRSTGRPIAPNFIRPYAICRTPSFIAKVAP